MSNSNKPDDRVVYLTLKNIFMGSVAEVRKLAAIRKVVRQERNRSDVQSLISAYGFETICASARALLHDKIFESTLRAKMRFPEVFDVSPTQSAEREAEEAEAVRCEANAISQVVQNTQIRGYTAPLIGQETETTSTETQAQRTHVGHNLYPVYLPIRSQNVLMTKIQSLLEQACFAFGRCALPEVLEARNWDCSEAVELNRWIAEFSARKEQFLAMDAKITRSLEDIFGSVAAIRHTAVHRLRISAKTLEQYLVDAESFLALIKDQANLEVVGRLRRETQAIVGELERSKHILNSKREKRQQEIAMQRAELDKLERMLAVDMVREDSDYQALAGANLEQAISMADTDPTSVDADPGDADSDDDFEDSCSEIFNTV